MKKLLNVIVLLLWIQQIYGNIHGLPAKGKYDILNVENSSPVFDGIADETLWDTMHWLGLNEVWMPFGTSIDSADFNGRYKAAWSDSTDKLYFLVETIDDDWVEGYTYPNSNYPSYDILEIFVDPDNSGGLHVFDNTGDDWGDNAENAFSHHITINFGENNQIVTDKVVCDIAGSDWSTDFEIRDYAGHFEDFAVRKQGNKITWEFSLTLYNDTYDHNNPQASKMELFTGDTIGLALAYCDADGAPGRDHFFGSFTGYSTPDKEGGKDIYNEGWKNADDYPRFILADTFTVIPYPDDNPGDMDDTVDVENPVNIVSYSEDIQWTNTDRQIIINLLGTGNKGELEIEIYDLNGNVIQHKTTTDRKTVIEKAALTKGIYIVRLQADETILIRKIAVY